MKREDGLLYCKTDTLLRKAAMKLSNTDWIILHFVWWE